MLLIPVAEAAGSFRFVRIQQSMLGVKDGVNAVFDTAEYFLKSAAITIEVFWNGRALTEGRDFLASEPGGIGTGYKRITLLWSRYLPTAEDSLTANYILGYGG